MTNGAVEFGQMTDRELLAAIYQQVLETNGKVRDHEKRLRLAERFQWMLVGMWTFVIAVGGLIAKSIPWGLLSKNR